MKRPVFKGVFLVLTLLVLAPLAAAQVIGACHVTEVPGPILLPDNSIEESGRLEICLNRVYSPVAGLHRTAINGKVSGLFVSRKVTGVVSTDNERPQVTFNRHTDGTYELESYTLTDGERRVTFEMRPGTVRSRWHLRAGLDRTRVAMPATTTVGF